MGLNKNVSKLYWTGEWEGGSETEDASQNSQFVAEFACALHNNLGSVGDLQDS